MIFEEQAVLTLMLIH